MSDTGEKPTQVHPFAGHALLVILRKGGKHWIEAQHDRLLFFLPIDVMLCIPVEKLPRGIEESAERLVDFPLPDAFGEGA